MAMNMNMNRMADVNTRTTSGGLGDLAKLVDGKNVLRIFSFAHKVTKADIDAGLYDKTHAKVGQSFDEVFHETMEHLGEGEAPLTCSGPATCPRCAQIVALSGTMDAKSLKRMQAKARFYVNAINTDRPGAGMHTYAFPSTVAGTIAGYIRNEDYTPEELLGCNGRDFVITRDSKASPSMMYNVQLRDAKKSEALPASLQGNVVDLFLNGSSAGAEKPSATTPTQVVEDEDEGDELVDEQTNDTVVVGTQVFFNVEGEAFVGKVVAIKGKTHEIETADDVWELERADFTTEAPKKARKTKTK